MSEYLSVSEAAQLLSVTTTTLRNWDAAGKLRAERDPSNNYRRYKLADVVAIMQTNETAEPPVNYEVQKAAQGFLFGQPHQDASEATEGIMDAKGLRLLVRQMSAAFRNSQGGGLLERFEEVTKLLFTKLYDERVSNGTRRFRKGKDEPASEVRSRIAKLYREACKELPTSPQNGWADLRDDAEAIATVVGLLENVKLGRVAEDVKGRVYEELIRNTFDKTDNQQFFTPQQVAAFLIALLDPKPGESIGDPASGSGGFLVEVYKHLENKYGVAADESNTLVLGLEVDRRMAWVAQMNLAMHGDGSGIVHHLPGGGSLALTDEMAQIVPDGSLDAIATNPPFGSDFSDAAQLQNYELGKGRQSRRRGVLFVERCIRLLKPGGRLGIVIDDSVLNGSSNEDVRRLILSKCDVDAVVSLPDVTFKPYATAKTSILLLTKKEAEGVPQGSPIFMAEIEHVGRKPNGDPDYLPGERDDEGRPVLNSELPEIARVWLNYVEGPEDITAHEPKVFLCPSARFWRSDGSIHESRLDVGFHHPSREVAKKALEESIYPTPKLAELIVLRTDSAVPNDEDPEGLWRYVGLAEIEANNGQYGVSEVLGSQVKSSVRAFKPKDILFSKLRPGLRKVIFINEADEPGYVSSECYVLRGLQDALSDPDLRDEARALLANQPWEVDGRYLAIMLRSDVVYGQLVYQTTGIGRPRISKATLLNVQIPLPPLSVQHEVVREHEAAWQNYLNHVSQGDLMYRKAQKALESAYSKTMSMIKSLGNQEPVKTRIDSVVRDATGPLREDKFAAFLSGNIDGDNSEMTDRILNDLIEPAISRMNQDRMQYRYGLFSDQSIPQNQANLTDTRTRMGVLLESEMARAIEEIIREDYSIDNWHVNYVIANQFPDLALRNNEGDMGLRLEIKAIETVAEEKAANFDTLIKDIRKDKDFVVVMIWGWAETGRRKDLWPEIKKFYVFDAYLLAKMRDTYWLNSPPVEEKLGGGRQGFDVVGAVTSTDKGFKEEEGNLGKVTRLYDPGVKAYLPPDVGAKCLPGRYEEFLNDLEWFGFKDVIRLLSVETGGRLRCLSDWERSARFYAASLDFSYPLPCSFDEVEEPSSGEIHPGTPQAVIFMSRHLKGDTASMRDYLEDYIRQHKPRYIVKMNRKFDWRVYRVECRKSKKGDSYNKPKIKQLNKPQGVKPRQLWKAINSRLFVTPQTKNLARRIHSLRLP